MDTKKTYFLQSSGGYKYLPFSRMESAFLVAKKLVRKGEEVTIKMVKIPIKKRTP